MQLEPASVAALPDSEPPLMDPPAAGAPQLIPAAAPVAQPTPQPTPAALPVAMPVAQPITASVSVAWSIVVPGGKLQIWTGGGRLNNIPRGGADLLIRPLTARYDRPTPKRGVATESNLGTYGTWLAPGDLGKILQRLQDYCSRSKSTSPASSKMP